MRCHGGGAAVTGIVWCTIGCAFLGTECVNRCPCDDLSRETRQLHFSPSRAPSLRPTSEWNEWCGPTEGHINQAGRGGEQREAYCNPGCKGGAGHAKLRSP